jgi:hypothetical protein
MENKTEEKILQLIEQYYAYRFASTMDNPGLTENGYGMNLYDFYLWLKSRRD